MHAHTRSAPHTLYLLWLFISILGFNTAFVLEAHPVGFYAVLFSAAVAFSYAFIYLLPSWAILALAARCRVDARHLWLPAAVLATTTHMLLLVDYEVFRLFGFHINGFVINLITTPGGLESMGADPDSERLVALIALGLFAVNAAIAFWSYRRPPAALRRGLPRGVKYAFITLLLATLLGERITYGIAHLQADSRILSAANQMPGYQRTTFRSFAKKLGYEMKRRPTVKAQVTRLNYPLRALDVAPPTRPMNVVMLVCESLRADALNPEVMPNLWAFANRSSRFDKHYSGGNGTRHGMFTLFYGLPGSYWFPTLEARRSPVLMDTLQAQGYELRLSTSAAFSYPEFDKTIFSKVPAEQLHSGPKGEGWQSDRHYVGEIEKWLKARQGTQPFFLFHFFESAHARYYFPEESIIRRPFLEEFNYVGVDPKRDIALIYNRYINAAHHLDSQLGRVLRALEASGEMDNTLVLITGDHGEEFMEHGHWGHNSTFTDPQVRVPFVLHVPGQAPAVYGHATSHLDVAPTLLPMLGVNNPAGDYSTGVPLTQADGRELLMFSDWNRIALMDDQYKAVFALQATTQLDAQVTHADDSPLRTDEGDALEEIAPKLGKLMQAMTRFSAH